MGRYNHLNQNLLDILKLKALLLLKKLYYRIENHLIFNVSEIIEYHES